MKRAPRERRHHSRRGIHRTIGLTNERTQRTRGGPTLRNLKQRIDASRSPLHVGVRDHNPFGFRINLRHPEVGGLPVADIAPGAQQLDVGLLGGHFGRPVGGTVIGQDQPQRAIGGVAQRSEEAMEMLARRVRHRHHGDLLERHRRATRAMRIRHGA